MKLRPLGGRVILKYQKAEENVGLEGDAIVEQSEGKRGRNRI